MQDGCRILGSGKSGKMAKRYQHHKLPSCLGYPKHEGKDEENLTHFFGHYRRDRTNAYRAKDGQKNNDEDSPTEAKDRRCFPHRE